VGLSQRCIFNFTGGTLMGASSRVFVEKYVKPTRVEKKKEDFL
jgi:hypothetical protein